MAGDDSTGQSPGNLPVGERGSKTVESHGSSTEMREQSEIKAASFENPYFRKQIERVLQEREAAKAGTTNTGTTSLVATATFAAEKGVHPLITAPTDIQHTVFDMTGPKEARRIQMHTRALPT